MILIINDIELHSIAPLRWTMDVHSN